MWWTLNSRETLSKVLVPDLVLAPHRYALSSVAPRQSKIHSEYRASAHVYVVIGARVISSYYTSYMLRFRILDVPCRYGM